jgi:hypothetical protein
MKEVERLLGIMSGNEVANHLATITRHYHKLVDACLEHRINGTLQERTPSDH